MPKVRFWPEAEEDRFSASSVEVSACDDMPPLTIQKEHTMKYLLAAFTLLTLAACSGGSGDDGSTDDDRGADLLLVNARVYTFDWPEPAADGTPAAGAPRGENGWRPDASAIAIAGDEIVFVGSNAAAEAYRGAATRVVDLAGATVLPGLVDSHTHVFPLGAKLTQVDLTDVGTEEEAVRIVAEAAAGVPAGQWIIGRGWDEGAWANRYPDKVFLSAALPDNPVALESLHSFAMWVNQAALDAAGVSAETPVPVGGEMRLGADGEPSGLFLNRATTLIRDAVPAPPHEVLVEQALAGLEQMAEDGYVAVHEAGLDTAQMAVLEELERDARLPVRVYAMLSLRDEELIRAWIERGPDSATAASAATATVSTRT